jgi:hypothetical protein
LVVVVVEEGLPTIVGRGKRQVIRGIRSRNKDVERDKIEVCCKTPKI